MKRILIAIAALVLLLPPSAPFWLNYFLSYGGYEHALINGMLAVALLTWAIIFASAWAITSCVVSLLRHRRVVLPMLKAGIVASLVLTLLLPNYVAKPMRQAGARARITSLGGESFAQSFRKETAILAEEAFQNHSDFVADTNLPPSFTSLEVEYARIQVSENGYTVDATTSGRPFRTGWIIVSPDADRPSGATTVRIAGNIYRY